MPSSVPSRAQSTPLHSMDLRMAKGSIPVHQSETSADLGVSADWLSLVLATLRDIGMSDKEACIHMDYDASLFSKVKRGDARLPFDALWRLPDRFWAEFQPRVMEARKLTEESKRAMKAARISELVRLLIEEVA